MRLTEPIVCLDARYTGPAYEYLLPTDVLPDYAVLPDNPVCAVKLFLPEGRLSYYVCALTNYGDGGPASELASLVITGWMRSPLGPDCDEMGDIALIELLALRTPTFGLPLERDLDFTPVPLDVLHRSGAAR